MIVRLAFSLLLACVCLPAAAGERDLDRWFDKELVPYVSQQLVQHPRFRGETVVFVVFEDQATVSVSNRLSLSLRDRLLDSALSTPGIALGWQQGRAGSVYGARDIDCTRDAVHYYVGIELARGIDGRYAVSVRALDLEDRKWVTGFGMNWHGRLSTVQREAAREARTDDTFRGTRDVPFSTDESDLLAAHLAHELTCALLRETSGSYVVGNEHAGNDADVLDATVELIGNNLANHDALELTGIDARVNAVLSGKAHRIDDALYQYWITVTPTDPESELSSLSTSAYVLLPGLRLADAAPLPGAGSLELLGPLRIVQAQGSAACGTTGRAGMQAAAYGAGRATCSLLTADSRTDAVVFFVEYQASHGLVRLGGAECRRRTAAQVVTAGDRVNFPLAGAVPGATRTRDIGEWQVDPGIDTYYALAVSDSRAARRFASHIDQLPLRCTGTIRPGLRNDALHRWLDELAMLAARHANHVDWRALEVKDVL